MDRYLEMAETIVEEQGVWIGQIALVSLFPLANPAQHTLDKVDAWLGSTSATAAAISSGSSSASPSNQSLAKL